MKQIVLSEKDFQDLVSGRIVQRHDVKIVLQKIGLKKVMDCVRNAQEKIWHKGPTERGNL